MEASDGRDPNDGHKTQADVGLGLGSGSGSGLGFGLGLGLGLGVGSASPASRRVLLNTCRVRRLLVQRAHPYRRG